jgi:hypothetical protein
VSLPRACAVVAAAPLVGEVEHVRGRVPLGGLACCSSGRELGAESRDSAPLAGSRGALDGRREGSVYDVDGTAREGCQRGLRRPRRRGTLGRFVGRNGPVLGLYLPRGFTILRWS